MTEYAHHCGRCGLGYYTKTGVAAHIFREHEPNNNTEAYTLLDLATIKNPPPATITEWP